MKTPIVIRLIAAGLTAGLCAWTAPTLTTIQDTLFKADGTKFNGMAQITWTTFENGNTVFVAANSKTVRIVDGSMLIRLVPTEGANPAAYYTVRYWGSGRVQFTETWSVPQSNLALRVRDVRTSGPLWPGGPAGAGNSTAGEGQIEITDVNGLSDELSSRPAKGTGYTNSRAAIIDATGKVAGAAGSATDCIRVDGTATPCGGIIQFIDNETPNGVVDGANTSFTLSDAPNPASSLLLFRNGILQRASVDFTLTGGVIHFVAAAVPQPGDVLVASFRK